MNLLVDSPEQLNLVPFAPLITNVPSMTIDSKAMLSGDFVRDGAKLWADRSFRVRSAPGEVRGARFLDFFPFDTGLNQEAMNTLFCPSQEKFHTVVFIILLRNFSFKGISRLFFPSSGLKQGGEVEVTPNQDMVLFVLFEDFLAVMLGNASYVFWIHFARNLDFHSKGRSLSLGRLFSMKRTGQEAC